VAEFDDLMPVGPGFFGACTARTVGEDEIVVVRVPFYDALVVGAGTGDEAHDGHAGAL